MRDWVITHDLVSGWKDQHFFLLSSASPFSDEDVNVGQWLTSAIVLGTEAKRKRSETIRKRKRSSKGYPPKGRMR